MSGVDTSPLIYGCMALGGAWDDSPLRDEQLEAAHAAVRAAYDAGLRVFDLADIYANGKSELAFGKILAHDTELASAAERGELTVQTKCGVRIPGNTGPAAAPVHYRLDRDTVRASLEGSLRRLGLERVDRFFVHRPDPLTPLGETARAMDEAHRESLIGSVGLSNVTLQHVTAFHRIMSTPLTAVQLQMSLEHRDFVETQVLANQHEGTRYSFPAGLLTLCASEQIELQAWGAMAGGRYSSGAQAATDDAAGSPAGGAAATGGETAGGGEAAGSGETSRGGEAVGDGQAVNARWAASAVVDRLAQELAVPREAVVVGWLLRHPYGIRPVVGTMNPQRIAACAQAPRAAAAMTHEQWYELWTAARGAPLP